MEDMSFKGLEKAAEDLKDLEEGDMAFVVCDKKTKEVWVDGSCAADFIFSIRDMITEYDSTYDIKVYKPMSAEELGDFIECLISLL